MKPASLEVNDRIYRWMRSPVVIVCVEGCEPAYLNAAVNAGITPYLQHMMEFGANLRAECVIPSINNPNSVSIVTGVPPSVHGICGNYFFDRAAGAAMMMDDPRYLRAGTVLAAFSEAGAEVAVVTAYEKNRQLLGHGLKGICFSGEKAGETTLAEHGIENVPKLVGMPAPALYSTALSEFVLASGVTLIRCYRPDLLYLSTTDFVQHQSAPGEPAANAFFRMLDRYMLRLDALGATIVLTSDHGLNEKHDGWGRANAIYLQDMLDLWYGADHAWVLLPITDQYVEHHGVLGSFATVYAANESDIGALIERIRLLPGIECVLTGAEAASRFDLPQDRIGDIVVIGNHNTVIGTSVGTHDLSSMRKPLRSNGGLAERRVPLLCNRPVIGIPNTRRLRNFDAFDIALNHVQ